MQHKRKESFFLSFHLSIMKCDLWLLSYPNNPTIGFNHEADLHDVLKIFDTFLKLWMKKWIIWKENWKATRNWVVMSLCHSLWFFDWAAFARLGPRCLSAVSAYDNTLEIVGTLDTAQAKFDDILNSPSVDAACDKIKSLAKSKELDSSLVLLINGAWASAKESSTMRNEVQTFVAHLIHKDTSTKIFPLINADFHHISRILTELSS